MRPRPTTTLAAVALLAAALGGCSGDPRSAPSGPPPTPASAADSEALPLSVTAGPVALLLSLPGGDVHDAPATVGPEQDGAVTVSVDPAAVPSGVVGVRLAPGGGTLQAYSDGGLAVLAADGALVGGLSAPSSGARFAVVGAGRAELRLPTPGAAQAAQPVTFTLGTRGIVSATWGEREGGRSVAVAPTGWARRAGDAGRELVWAELIAAEPEADTTTMRDQLICHTIGAPDKATWNLEPWRPEVGLLATMAARCNPT
ncbi:DUF2599 domain-containing protein [Xylanimonas ulmi]|uniref:Uncharacterized protein DUF2599 n=1 Tax=Xylanimonas ulmi TaxID=228973 RepID=A0A4Q7LZ65_9MICO|nr:DUF2599 domain-containing protein [Xylanibacterium ulmi]RZS60234.1 uncharacterized protein DUF2599 [Xylanibacterium ulmi]